MSLEDALQAASWGLKVQNKRFHRRAFVRAAIAMAVVAPTLAGCGGTGFRPLHATGGFGGAGIQRLSDVQVAPIPGRVGQQLRNELVFQSGANKPVDPKYRLEIAIRKKIASSLVQRDGEAQSKTFSLDANFRLIDLETKEVVLKGQSTSRANFERFESIFANVRARRDAENRAAKTVGNELKTRLESYLASQAA